MHEVKTVAVVGAGQMGGGIAQVAAQSGFSTLVYDAFPGAIDKAAANHTKFMAKSVEKGKLAQADMDAALSRLKYVSSLDALSGAADLLERVLETGPGAAG